MTDIDTTTEDAGIPNPPGTPLHEAVAALRELFKVVPFFPMTTADHEAVENYPWDRWVETYASALDIGTILVSNCPDLDSFQIIKRYVR